MDQRKAISPPSERNVASPSSAWASNLGLFSEKSPETSRDFGAEFFSMYRAIFPPRSCSTPSPLPSSLSLTPSTRSSSSSAGFGNGDECEISATEHRLNQARLILERQQLGDHYDLCQKQLQIINKEIDFLRRENSELRSVNAELVRILSSPTALRNFVLSQTSSSSFSRENSAGGGSPSVSAGNITVALSPDLSHASDEISDISPTSVIEPNRFERRNSNNADRVSLPKSISVRSTGYQKTAVVEGPSRSSSTRPRTQPSQLAPGTQRVYVPGVVAAEKDEEESDGASGLELEVFNQGMFKTELCNKWQQTGACPYGDHCQFAHGISELRPVIRHPRYKTEICRMVLNGDRCPYGHRCHFRHSLTEEERLLLPQ